MKFDADRRIDLAYGNIKAEMVLKNAKIVNVFSHEIIDGDIAIDNGKIVGIGKYDGLEEIDMKGKYVSPGFIDGHVHIESSMVSPGEFARAVVPRGTTTIVADPHEIANVSGIDGIKYMIDATEKLPLDVYFMIPSCVPATSFENSGAVLKAEDLESIIDHERVLGLGELMDYPGVIYKDKDVIDKVELAHKYNKLIDGHAPEISGKELNAYVSAGILTEHECSTVDEMIDRLRLGMYILIRQGSAARNLEELIKGLTKENMTRCLFCTDDKHPEDILADGHIDNNLRLAVEKGIDPISSIKIATINAAQCYGLKNKGAIALGYDADLVVLDDLEQLNVLQVFKLGEIVAQDKKALFDTIETDTSKVTNTVNVGDIEQEDISIKLKSHSVNVMKLLAHNLVTKKVERKVKVSKGEFEYDDSKDILKLAVIERHKMTGNVGLGLVEGFGLKNGAIASTVAHDSHNIVVIGDNDEDILAAVKEVKRVGGGITISSNGEILSTLDLPIAGLISDRSMEEVNNKLKTMLEISYEKLSVNKDIEPFMTLSFLALPVIPEIKLTDMGLFDVTKFEFIDIETS